MRKYWRIDDIAENDVGCTDSERYYLIEYCLEFVATRLIIR